MHVTIVSGVSLGNFHENQPIYKKVDGVSPKRGCERMANKTTHFVASWYRPPGGDLEKIDSQLKSLRSQLEKIKDIHKANKPPSVHILGDFNFCDIVWPDRLSKSGSPLSPSEGEKFIEILKDHHLEQLVHFPTREKNTLDLIITYLPTQFLDIQSPDRLSDHDIVSGTLKIVIPPIKKPRRKVYRYQKGDYESMRSDAFNLQKKGISTDTRILAQFKKNST